MDGEALSLLGVSKRFGERRVVSELSLHVPQGKIFGLLGPNGAGKTTLLRMVMGLLPPSEGTLRLFGKYAPGAAEARRLLGYMPQALSLYPALSMRENLAFFARLYRVPEAALDARVDDLIARVALGEHAEVPVQHLSGGMARRVMLASALVHQPRLLILDEPTAGVDPVLRVRFWDWLQELVDDGVSIIVTTHHIAEASRADDVVFLRAGRLLDQGAPGELMARYASDDLEAAFVKATTAEPAGQGA